MREKPEPLAPLEATIEAIERRDARGGLVKALEEDDLREKLKELAADALESCHFDKFGVRILSHSCDRCED